jgi:hypothetical protein
VKRVYRNTIPYSELSSPMFFRLSLSLQEP